MSDWGRACGSGGCAVPRPFCRLGRSAGAHRYLDALPAGYETILSPEYDGGRDLSIGQWQRVALARAFIRDAPLIILDEPTAALDPRAEHDLYTRIRSLYKGRTKLLISHRYNSSAGSYSRSTPSRAADWAMKPRRGRGT